MANAKVIFGNETLIDLTGDTVNPGDVAKGKTFHKKSGETATGTGQIAVGVSSTGNFASRLYGKDVVVYDSNNVEVTRATIGNNGKTFLMLSAAGTYTFSVTYDDT